jgi:hypothetical protein
MNLVQLVLDLNKILKSPKFRWLPKHLNHIGEWLEVAFYIDSHDNIIVITAYSENDTIKSRLN